MRALRAAQQHPPSQCDTNLQLPWTFMICETSLPLWERQQREVPNLDFLPRVSLHTCPMSKSSTQQHCLQISVLWLSTFYPPNSPPQTRFWNKPPKLLMPKRNRKNINLDYIGLNFSFSNGVRSVTSSNHGLPRCLMLVRSFKQHVNRTTSAAKGRLLS